LLRVLEPHLYELYPNQRAVGKVLLDGTTFSPGIDLNLLRAKVGMVFSRSRRRSR